MSAQKHRIFEQTKPAAQLPSSQHNKSFFQTEQQPLEKVNPNFQFNNENLPRVTCHYHYDQYITMICRHPSCLLPLCPHCVKIHTQEHQAYNTYTQLDTLDNCLNEQYFNVANHCNRLIDEMNDIHRVSGITGEGFRVFNIFLFFSQQDLNEKLKQARSQCHQIVDNFFKTLENDLLQEIDSNKHFIQTQSGSFSKYLGQRCKSLQGLLQKFGTDKCVKHLVKHLQSEAEQDHELYYHESRQFSKQLSKCTPEILVDQTGLYQLNLDLARFISIKQSMALQKPQMKYESTMYNNNQPMYNNNQPMYNNNQPHEFQQFPQPQPQPQPIGFPVSPPPMPPAQQQSILQSPIENRDSDIHPYLRTPPQASKFRNDRSFLANKPQPQADRSYRY